MNTPIMEDSDETTRLRAEIIRLKQHIIFQDDVGKSPRDVYELVRRETFQKHQKELASLKLLHEQQTQSLLAARIEAKLVADELRNLIGLASPWTVIILTPIISRLRKIAEGK